MLLPAPHLVAALAWFAALGVARGQLGEPGAGIARLYGAPVRRHARVHAHAIIGNDSTPGDVHLKDGCYIRIIYARAVCVQAEFSRQEGELSLAQVEAILAKAGDGSRWRRVPGGSEAHAFYRRADGQALASWTVGPEGSLLITSEDSAGWGAKLLTR